MRFPCRTFEPSFHRRIHKFGTGILYNRAALWRSRLDSFSALPTFCCRLGCRLELKDAEQTFMTEKWTPEKVRRLRGQRTQVQFGRLLKVPKNTIWRWEAGYARPDTKRSQRLSRLAKAERFQAEWTLAGSATLIADLEEGSR